MSSPIGELGLLANDSQLLELSLRGLKGLSARGKRKESRFKLELLQLKQYFQKERESFSFDIRIEGTEFQKAVFENMRSIKYGQVLSYKDLASKVGLPKAYRAVGTACGSNRIPIIIPCHRVVSTNGLGGFGGGLERKKFLLNLESH